MLRSHFHSHFTAIRQGFLVAGGLLFAGLLFLPLGTQAQELPPLTPLVAPEEKAKLPVEPALPELPLPIMEEPSLPDHAPAGVGEALTPEGDVENLAAPRASSAVLEAQALALEAGVDKGKIADLLAIIADLEVRQAVMGRELVKTKTEVGSLREKNDQMKLQMQALGVAALSGDERSLQLRLLNAVSDYRVADQKNQSLTERLVQLCDAVTAWQHSSDVSSRRRLDEALAEASGVLEGSAPAEELSPTPVEQARVVSFKRELGLAVVNCGKASGLRLGMPLAFVRKDRTIAQGVIVDCRDQLCGVLITSTPVTKDGVTLGDAIKLETTEKTK